MTVCVMAKKRLRKSGKMIWNWWIMFHFKWWRATHSQLSHFQLKMLTFINGFLMVKLNNPLPIKKKLNNPFMYNKDIMCYIGVRLKRSKKAQWRHHKTRTVRITRQSPNVSSLTVTGDSMNGQWGEKHATKKERRDCCLNHVTLNLLNSLVLSSQQHWEGTFCILL